MVQQKDSIEVSYGWVIVFASLAIHTIALGAPILIFVALKPIAADFDWPRSVPSMAYSLMMIGTGVGGIAMGWWMDRRGVMQPVLFGSIMVGLGALLASQSDARWSFYAANGILIGLLGKAAMIAPLVANATRWFDRRRGLAVAIIASGQGVAGAVWPPVVRYLNDGFGWRDTYVYFGVFALATMVPLALVLKPKAPISSSAGAHGASQEGDRVLGLPASAVQGLLWVATIGCCAAMAVPIVHLVSHATDLGHSKEQAVGILSVLFGAAFVSRIAFGIVADRIGAALTLLIGSAGQAVILVMFAFVDGLTGLYVAALLFGLGFSGIMPCYALLIRLWFPATQAGLRIASQYLFAASGMALGGWMGGALFDLTGTYIAAFMVAFGFGIMNLLTIVFLYSRQSRVGLSPLPA